MTSMPSPAATRPARWTAPLRSWRTVASVAALTGGAAAVVGSFLPWASAFAGLVAIPGTRGANGKALAAAGVVIAVAGLWHLIRGGNASRWLFGILGAAVLGYSGYLLMRLAASLHSLGGDSMVLLRGGPGLWIVAAGGLAAFATLFLPASSQAAFRAARGRGTASLAAWAADWQSAGPRRWLQIALGLAWLLDAALQFQPYMFTRGFVTQILGPAGLGSPALISNSIMGAGQVMLSQVAIFNAIFATIQLALGIGLLWRRTSHAALAATIGWALSVWWLGEGLGGILTGSASPVTGAPGAALIYAVIALLAWPARGGTRAAAGSIAASSIAAGSRVGLRGAQLIWAALWISSAYLILQAPNRAAAALHDTVAGLAAGEPGWIAAMDRGAAGLIGSGGIAFSVVAAVAFLVIAAGVFLPAVTRPALILAALAALVMWAVGQDFGGILTGQGTDPSTGPLLVLLAAAFWPLRGSVQTQRQDGAAPSTTGERSPVLASQGSRVSPGAPR